MAVAAAAVAIADSSECFDFVLSQKKALQAAAPFFLDISSQFVFVVDTWRNPAVEAQAIDRAHHRIGENRPLLRDVDPLAIVSFAPLRQNGSQKGGTFSGLAANQLVHC